MKSMGRIETEGLERHSLSDLPDYVLLHIMEFMHTKYAVQTCVLSKRWKNLWKRLTTLTFDSADFSRLKLSSFENFVSWVLYCRDDSFKLHNLVLWQDSLDPRLLNKVMKYVAWHDVRQLKIIGRLNLKEDFELPSCIFSCRYLTFLKFSFWLSNKKIKLPKSLEFSALKSLHIKNVTFATSDYGCAEHFSKCHMLNTLVIEHCYLQNDDARVLRISNSKLSSLTIIGYEWEKAYEITLSTPNLNLLTIRGIPHKLCSTSNMTCLEEVDVNVRYHEDFQMSNLVVIGWLQMAVNVKIMTLSWSTFEIIKAIRTQLPSFVRLTSLKLYSCIPDVEVSRMVEYLLQNSPLTRVDIIQLKI